MSISGPIAEFSHRLASATYHHLVQYVQVVALVSLHQSHHVYEIRKYATFFILDSEYIMIQQLIQHPINYNYPRILQW